MPARLLPVSPSIWMPALTTSLSSCSPLPETIRSSDSPRWPRPCPAELPRAAARRGSRHWRRLMDDLDVDIDGFAGPGLRAHSPRAGPDQKAHRNRARAEEVTVPARSPGSQGRHETRSDCSEQPGPVSYTHLRAHETVLD